MRKIRLHPEHFRRRYRQYKSNPLLPATPKQKRRRLFFLRHSMMSLRPAIRLFVIFGTILFLGWSVYLVFISDYFAIRHIVVERNGEKIAHAGIKEAFTPLEGKNILFTSLAEQTQDLLEAHAAEFESLDISRDLPDTILISFVEFPNTANLVTVQKTILKKFIINSQGFIIRENEEDANLPYIRYMNQDELKTGHEVISPERLAKILLAHKTFIDRFGMKIFEVLYYPIEREVHLKTERDFVVWLDLEQDVLQQLQKLKRALPKLDIYKENIEYIDLRIAGRTGEKIIFKKR